MIYSMQQFYSILKWTTKFTLGEGENNYGKFSESEREWDLENERENREKNIYEKA
jgi:hypothetical protein